VSERTVKKVTSFEATDGKGFLTLEEAISHQIKLELEEFCIQRGIFGEGLPALDVAEGLFDWQDQLRSILAGEPQ